jgi:hypothetical protein
MSPADDNRSFVTTEAPECLLLAPLSHSANDRNLPDRYLALLEGWVGAVGNLVSELPPSRDALEVATRMKNLTIF